MDVNKSPSRRAVLRSGGVVGGVGIAGCVSSDADEDGVANGAAGDPDGNETADETEAAVAESSIENGAVTFIYDDGPVEDLEIALPAHEKYDAPANAGIVYNWMGADDDRWLDRDGVRTLYDAGWEISCHTADHLALGAFELSQDVSPDETRVYTSRSHRGVLSGYDLEITDGERSVERTIVDVDSDDTGRYIEFEEPVGEAFEAWDAIERYTEDEVRNQIETNKQGLSAFEPTTFVGPHNVVGAQATEIIREYYDGVFNANIAEMVNPRPFDPFEATRDYFAERTNRDEVYQDLVTIAEENKYGILGAHTFRDEVTQKRIENTLHWCEELGIEVLTFEDAIDRFGT